MYKILWPEKDSTLYSNFPNRNTGADEILEISKTLPNEIKDTEPGVSRIIIQFKDSDFEDLNNVDDFKAFLSLSTAQVVGINTKYQIEAKAVSGSWYNSNGFFNNNPPIESGVSWNNRDVNEEWNTPGADTHNTSAIQTFNLENSDINIDVTEIVKDWVSGTYDNDGFLLKFTNNIEESNNPYGKLQFFSRETHTIFMPTLKIFWDSSDNYNNEFETVTSNYRIFLKNLKRSFTTSEKVKIRLGVIETFTTQSYTKQKQQNEIKILENNLMFSIVDSVTKLPIVPFDEVGTKVHLDEDGYYFYLDLNNFLPVRYYTILFKEYGDSVNLIHDNNFNFVVR